MASTGCNSFSSCVLHRHAALLVEKPSAAGLVSAFDEVVFVHLIRFSSSSFCCSPHVLNYTDLRISVQGEDLPRREFRTCCVPAAAALSGIHLPSIQRPMWFLFLDLWLLVEHRFAYQGSPKIVPDLVIGFTTKLCHDGICVYKRFCIQQRQYSHAPSQFSPVARTYVKRHVNRLTCSTAGSEPGRALVKLHTRGHQH